MESIIINETRAAHTGAALFVFAVLLQVSKLYYQG